MAKSGTPRHSKPARKPVTINLDPADVKQVDGASPAKTPPPAEPVGDYASVANPKVDTKPKRDVKNERKASPEMLKNQTPEKPETPPFKAGEKPEFKPNPEVKHTNAASAQAGTPQENGAKTGMSHLLSGVAGGVIALCGLYALQLANIVPMSGMRDTNQLATMEQQIAELRANPAPAPLDEASKAEMAQLQKNVEAAEIKAEAAIGSLNEMQKQFDALPQGQAANTADLDGLTQRLSALEAQISAATSQAEQASANVTDNSGTISAIEQQLASLEQKLSEVARQPDTTALIAANTLKTAIDRGGSFKAELETFAAVSPDQAGLEGLSAFAETGVPTIASLNSEFDDVANRIIATENKLPADAGVWDQLKASAKGLVSVRPVAGNVSGSGVGPITARMEAALQSGDLERAIGEWEQLPADARVVSEEFAAQMKARRDANLLIQQLITESLSPKTSNNAPSAPAEPATTAPAAAPSGN